MNVAELFRRRAAEHPNRDAIIDLTGSSPRTLTYAELESAAGIAAAAFTRAGLGRGARVVVLHPIDAGLYVAIAGMLRANLVPVACDPGAGREHFNQACESVSPQAVFATARGHLYAMTLPALAGVRKRFCTMPLPGTIDITREREPSTIAKCDDDEPALITFTSGSTGKRKAIVRTHGLLRAQLEAIQAMLPLGGIDVATMPIVLLANLASGATSVIPGVDLRRPSRANPHRLARDIECTGATSIVASPALLTGLTRVDPGSLRTLQRVVTGGGPVMPSLISALRRQLPDAEIFAVYGSSEAEPIACLPCASLSEADFKQMHDGAGLLAGSPVAHSTVRIVDGEIVVAGDHVVPGYLHGIGDNETKLHAHGRIWHRTGDGGYFDDSGRLWLTGRVQAVIHDHRGTVEPFRVECALSSDRGIARSALIGTGGRRVLFVEPRPEWSGDIQAVKAQLLWARIDEVRVVSRLPVDRRHNAKIDYEALRGLVA